LTNGVQAGINATRAKVAKPAKALLSFTSNPRARWAVLASIAGSEMNDRLAYDAAEWNARERAASPVYRTHHGYREERFHQTSGGHGRPEFGDRTIS
jgi:hypothetical protein